MVVDGCQIMLPMNPNTIILSSHLCVIEYYCYLFVHLYLFLQFAGKILLKEYIKCWAQMKEVYHCIY